MGTQNKKKRAAPQNEFISGFVGTGNSPGKEPRQSSVTRPKKTAKGLSSDKSASSSRGRAGTNPYQLTQQVNKNTGTEQLSNNPFENNPSPGLIRKLKTRLFNEESTPGAARQRVMVVMIPVLFVIMIFMFRQVLWKAPKKTRGANKEQKSVAAAGNSSSDDIEWKIPDPLPAKMRDPIKFENNISEGADTGKISGSSDTTILNVKSILYSKDKPSVVIGNKLIYLNGQVNGAVVAEIHKDYIVFEKRGKRWSQRVAE
jgi:hypothetical protein